MTKLALVLVIIGALNWGLIGLFQFDLIATLFGVGMLPRIILGIVGIAGLWCISLLFRRDDEVRYSHHNV